MNEIHKLVNKINNNINNKKLSKNYLSKIIELNKKLKFIKKKGGNPNTILNNNNLSIKINNNNIKNIVNNNLNQSKKNNIINELLNLNNKSDNLILNKNNNNKRNLFVNKSNLFNPIGILDPEGKQLNPLTKLPYQNLYTNANKFPNTYTGYAEIWANLPMYVQKTEETINAIYNNNVVLIISGTGSGKTVLTPKFTLHALNYNAKIAITNPKQIPSKENAEYAAKCLDVKLGEEVGYKYRGSPDDSYSKDKTKLLYCTDGYILARLKGDPMLKDFDCVIIDEAHERGVQIDLLLLELKQLILRRPEFKLIIMSATINEKTFIDYFPENKFKFKLVDAGQAPNFPVEQIFLKKPVNKFDENLNLIGKEWMDKMVDICVDILTTTDEGDILAFVTGQGDGTNVTTLLKKKISDINKNRANKIYYTILTGKSDDKTKTLATNNKKYKNLNNGYDRKIILATEVAESSLTFKGLKYVIDSGLANVSKYYPDTDINALEKKYISKASHDQRKGRTGRTCPGICYNLFTEKEYKDLFLDYSISPIKLENLDSILINLLSNKNYTTGINLPFKFY